MLTNLALALTLTGKAKEALDYLARAQDARLIVIEGNYLLSDELPWSLARSLYAETWFVATPEPERMRRLVARHTRFGRTEAEARRWAETVDGANAALIEPTAASADLIIDRLDGARLGD